MSDNSKECDLNMHFKGVIERHEKKTIKSIVLNLLLHSRETVVCSCKKKIHHVYIKGKKTYFYLTTKSLTEKMRLIVTELCSVRKIRPIKLSSLRKKEMLFNQSSELQCIIK